MSQPYITAEGFERLQQELDHLWRVERPRVTHEVSVAAAHGDRSENAEYIYGKKRLREIDARLRFLRLRVEKLVVVRETPVDQRDRVLFGAWVTLENEEGEEFRYRVVGADEFDAARGWISVDSPLGRALIGKRVDDEVTVDRPRGRVSYTLCAISYESPASNESESSS